MADTFGGGKNRATLNNVIPASTGATVAVGKVLPHLNGKLNGTALRVPNGTGSVVEAVHQIDGTATAAEVVAALAANAERINAGTLMGQVITVNDYYECSRDCVGEPFSSMVSGNVLVVSAGTDSLIKVTSFYEMGFSHAWPNWP